MQTRGRRGHISCTWVQCATFFDRSTRGAIFVYSSAEKHKLGRRRWDLASCQVSLNSVQRFQKEVKISQPIRRQTAILFFWSARKHKLGREHWDLASCEVSLNSVQRFKRRSWKCLSQAEARAALFSNWPTKQNRSTEGCSKVKRSADITSSGKNGLNIRTNASPKWDRTRRPEEQAPPVGQPHPLQCSMETSKFRQQGQNR